jgi:hypothetical protein
VLPVLDVLSVLSAVGRLVAILTFLDYSFRFKIADHLLGDQTMTFSLMAPSLGKISFSIASISLSIWTDCIVIKVREDKQIINNVARIKTNRTGIFRYSTR